MNKTKYTRERVTHKAKRVSAVGALSLTAAVAPALLPDSAQAKTTHKGTESIAALAKMIEVQGPSPQASVELFADLPNEQQAEMTMQSASTDPKDVEYVDIFVYKPEDNKEHAYIDPVIDITFTKLPDGKWNASKQVASNRRPHVLQNTIVNNSASVSTYTQTVEHGSIVDTHPTEVDNRAYAHETLAHLREQAGHVLEHVLAGQAVPSAELH